MVNGRAFALGAIGGAGVSVQLALAGRAVASTGSATEEASQSGIRSRTAVWGLLGASGHGRRPRTHAERTCLDSYITREELSLRMATAFGVLADAHRRQILDLLRIRDRAVGELVDQLGLSQPGVSKHLRMLREAGLVTVRHDAQRRWYGLRAEPLAEIDDWLAPYRAFWSDRLDALERHLEENPE